MQKILEKYILILYFLSVLSSTSVYVYIPFSKKEAKALTTEFFYIEYKEIDRAEILRKFFEKYKSPLIESSNKFVEIADKYEIDYRLLPSISCMESTCGRFLIPNTYNPFGWGIYGNNYISFASYDEAIEKVGKGIANNYISKGWDTPEKIAPIYTPPNSFHWMWGVNFFYNEIDKISAEI